MVDSVDELRSETFCVIDTETTGGDPGDGGITEVGAVLVCGGTVLGEWSSLVDPGVPIPPFVSALTGIRAKTVAGAPRFADIANDLRAFIGDTVIVGHNIRYDIAFLSTEFERCGHPRLTNPTVCTLALARRLVRDEVSDCKLGTLADQLRLAHRPSHRALDDALATTDLFMTLLDRAGRLGVNTMSDLADLPRLAGHPQLAKLRLTDDLPHAPGVYLFKDRSGNVLYVGKATDLRARVRSYFSSDDRRKVAELLRAVTTIDHEVCVHPLEAAVREVHLIAEYLPRFNSQATRWRSMAYVRLTDEPFPRLIVTRTAPPRDAVYLGPLPSCSAGHRVIEAITTVVPLRRCTERIPPRPPGQLRFPGVADEPLRTPCAPAQLGVACCPCSGSISVDDYAILCDTIRRGFTTEPDVLLGPLRERIGRLAARQRFEQAAEVRDRASTLAEAIRRRRRLEAWRTPERIIAELPDGSGVEIRHGRFSRAWSPPTPASSLVSCEPQASPIPTGAVPREEAYERLCIITELERAQSRWRIVHVDGELGEPTSAIDRFRPIKSEQVRANPSQSEPAIQTRHPDELTSPR